MGVANLGKNYIWMWRNFSLRRPPLVTELLKSSRGHHLRLLLLLRLLAEGESINLERLLLVKVKTGEWLTRK